MRRVVRYWFAVVVIVLAAVALRKSAYYGTLLADDWDHYAMVERIYPGNVPAWDMFNFVEDTDESRVSLQTLGRLPWWSAPNLHLAVFRPLSSLLVYLDYAGLDGVHHSERMRVHSYLWWVLLLVGVAALLQRLLPAPAALLALLLYAVDDAHVYPVAWIANRSEVIAVTFVTWGLWAHVTASRAQSAKHLRVAAAMLCALGVLSGEHAVAPLCYIGAFELLRRHTSWQSRVMSLLPYALIVVSYMIVRGTLGYGVAGSAFYIDPATEPLRYLTTAATRIPLLLGDLSFGMPAEWWYWGPPWRSAELVQRYVPVRWLGTYAMQSLQVGLGWLALLGSACALAFLSSRRAPRSARALRWLLLGALVSLLPLAGTASMSRLTVSPSIGFSAILGYVLWACAGRCLRPGQLLPRLAAAGAVLVILQLHLVRAALASYSGTGQLVEASLRDTQWVKQAEYPRPNLADTQIIVITAHDMATQFCLPFIIHASGHPAPLSSHILSPAADNEQHLFRPTLNQLELSYPQPLRNQPFAPMVYRAGELPFFVGQVFHGSAFDVEIRALRYGEPQVLRFTFPRPLDDPHYAFMYPREEGLMPLELPAVGEGLRLSPPSWPH